MASPESQRIARLLEFHKQTPTDPFICHALGLEYAGAADYALATAYFNKALEADPDYVATYLHLGKACEAARQHMTAREVYQKGIDAAVRLGDEHARGELEAALQLLNDGSA
jgi:Tfp pilus assembly protein PilF